MAVRGGSNDATLPSIYSETIGSDQGQVVRLDKGASTTRVPVTDTDGLPVEGVANGTPMPVGSHAVVVSATPTLDTSAYAAGDSLHTAVLTFANAAGWSGGSGVIYKTLVIDADKQSASGELWLFDSTVTPAAANAAHSISDADAAKCVGVIPFGPYYASALNSVSVNATTVLPFKCAATSLFGILVTRGTPTHTASGLVVSLHIAQD